MTLKFSFTRKPKTSALSSPTVPFFTPSALRPSRSSLQQPVPTSSSSSAAAAARLDFTHTLKQIKTMAMDRITLPRARFEVHLPQITWAQKKQQQQPSFALAPVEVDLEFRTDLSSAGKSDKIGETLSYSDLYKAAKSVACAGAGSGNNGEPTFKGGIQQLASAVAQAIPLPPTSAPSSSSSTEAGLCSSLRVQVTRPNSVLTADSLFVVHHRTQSGSGDDTTTISSSEEVGIKGYRVQSVIGLWEHERCQSQPMSLSVSCVLKPGASWVVEAMLGVIDKHVESSHPALLETFLEDLAATMLASLPLQRITVEVHKPFGNIYTDPPQVEITRHAPSGLSTSNPWPHPLKSNATAIMGIINLTPDSFATEPSTLDSALALAREHLDAGATILDLGAMSTRPGASDVPAPQELQRMLPFIRALRATDWGRHVTLSIDTFRASVADAALEAGANWINDVQAGAHTADGDMWAVAKKWHCPIVLMHMRGDPSTMTRLTDYGPTDVVDTIRDELMVRVQEALDAGVKPEQIIVDPGLGFAKDGPTNWTLCRRLQEWHQEGPLAPFPLLVGASRKRFLGDLTGKTASERDAATAGLMLDSIRQGAHVVRVHSSKAVQDVVAVADRLYK